MECVISHHRVVKKDAVRFMHESGGPCQEEKVCYPFAACNWVAESIHKNAPPTCPSCRENILGLKYFGNLTVEEEQEKPLTGRVDKQYPNGAVGHLSRLLSMYLESNKELPVEKMYEIKNKAIEAQNAEQVTQGSEDNEPCVYFRLYRAAQRTGVGNILCAMGALGVITVVTLWDCITEPLGPAKPTDFERSRVR